MSIICHLIRGNRPIVILSILCGCRHENMTRTNICAINSNMHYKITNLHLRGKNVEIYKICKIHLVLF